MFRHLGALPWLALLGWAAFRPGLDGYFTADDFGFLAVARYLDNPLYLLGDHFPGSLYYRPLGQFFWWLGYRLAGADPYGHHLLDLGLHVLNAWLLYRLLLRLHPSVPAALGAASLFVVHPLALGTLAWLSDRFDLLALGCSLVCLSYTLDYAAGGRGRDRMLALAALALALLAKELAYLLPVAATVALFTLPSRRPGWRARVEAVLPYWLLAAAMLALRHALLGGPGGVEMADPVAAVRLGMSHWLGALPGYLAYPFGPGAGLGLAAGLGALWLWRGRAAASLPGLLLGAALVLLAGLVQAPVAAVTHFPNPVAGPDPALLSACRFFYFALTGVLMMAHAVLAPLPGTERGGARLGGVLGLALAGLLLVQGGAGYRLLEDHRQADDGRERAFTELAAGVMERLDTPPGCKLYLLGLEGRGLSLERHLDVALKAVAPPKAGVLDCFIQSQAHSYYYLLPSGLVGAGAEAPLEPFYRPSLLGNLAFMYLELPGDPAARQALVLDPQARFLEYDGQGLVDVTVAVRAGVRPVAFR